VASDAADVASDAADMASDAALSCLYASGHGRGQDGQ
jgi:hypothetical protein